MRRSLATKMSARSERVPVTATVAIAMTMIDTLTRNVVRDA